VPSFTLLVSYMPMPYRRLLNGKHRRLPGVEVRPGSIKQARQDAGLSLSQVAANDISRTAIHLAETGKTRPTMPTIELIASRTGKPVDFFLESEGNDLGRRTQATPVIERLRALAATERFEEIRSLVEAADLQAVGRIDRALVLFYLAQAQVRLGDPRAALEQARQIMPTFSEAGDHRMVVECVDLESAALCELEDASALDTAERGLAMCRSLEPPDRRLEARLLGRLGAIHVARHEWPQAIESYQQAIDAADELKDLSRLGKMHSDLSIAYERLGDLPRAHDHSRRAVVIHELLQDRLSVARAENNLGLVLMKEGDMEGAREHLNRSLRICEEAGIEVGATHVLLSLAELELDNGDLNGARRLLDRARQLAQKRDEKASLALTHQLLGRVSEASGLASEADQEFNTAIAILDAAGLSQRLVTCLTEYARLLERRGATTEALEYMKRALVVSRPDLQDSGKLAFNMQTA
jgi:tetratricopeptide (TPR) repeat protein